MNIDIFKILKSHHESNSYNATSLNNLTLFQDAYNDIYR